MNDEVQLSAVQAKMACNALVTTQYGPDRASLKVELGAVYSTTGENAAFSKATPSGACWMQIDQGMPAAQFFKAGKKYYVTFTEAPD